MTRLSAAVSTFAILVLMLGMRAEANTDFALIDSDGVFHNMSWYNDKEQIALLVASADSSEEAKAAFFAKVALHPEICRRNSQSNFHSKKDESWVWC